MDRDKISRMATEEFDIFHSILKARNIDLMVLEDDPDVFTPDSVFPNNWISFHEDGTVVIYPMESTYRRKERRYDIMEKLREYGFSIRKIIDFTCFENRNLFLESTGSIVFDYVPQKGYICRSSRSSGIVGDALSKLLGFTPVYFNAVDLEGQAIYHTNVMMCVGEEFCIICLDSIADPVEREMVKNSLEFDGKELVKLTMEQLYAFAGNMLQIQDREGKKYLIMSESAYQSLETSQIETIQQYCDIIHVPIPTIEKYGGGSVRCMLAAVMLPFKK
jgi:hypothetical protein